LQKRGRGRKDITRQYGWRECNLRYRSCKLIIKGERMQFDYTNSKNSPKCKRLREWMKIKNSLKWYRQCKVWLATSYCLNSNGHIPLGGEHVVFKFAHAIFLCAIFTFLPLPFRLRNPLCHMNSPKCLFNSSFLVHCFIVVLEISSHASTVFQWNWREHTDGIFEKL
jgi:hypothetical protein